MPGFGFGPGLNFLRQFLGGGPMNPPAGPPPAGTATLMTETSDDLLTESGDAMTMES